MYTKMYIICKDINTHCMNIYEHNDDENDNSQTSDDTVKNKTSEHIDILIVLLLVFGE